MKFFLIVDIVNQSSLFLSVVPAIIQIPQLWRVFNNNSAEKQAVSGFYFFVCLDTINNDVKNEVKFTT
jgi:hypothetical protein